MGILIAILFFGLVVFVHEFGHFITARMCKVEVTEFAIGMGPAIFKHTSKKSGTLYSIRLLPIGGYTAMLGEDEVVEGKNALCNRPRIQRFFVMVAGSVMNIILGIVIMFIFVAQSNTYYSNTVRGFVQGAPSYSAGLRSGDKILKINGTPISVYTDITSTIVLDGTEPLDFTVERSGQEIVIENIQFEVKTEKGMSYGVIDFGLEQMTPSVKLLFSQSVKQSFSTIKIIYKSFIKLITGQYGFESVSGPVGIIDQLGQVAESGSETAFLELLYLFVFITMNLGVFNLLPIPALDGSKILFLIIEAIRRKPVPAKYENMVHYCGMAVLLLFMAVVTVIDVLRIVS